MARASSAGSVIRDEPGRADILLGSSLHCEAKQKNEQENQTFFHDCNTFNCQSMFTTSLSQLFYCRFLAKNKSLGTTRQ